MSKAAFLFPGQGAQSVGMGRELAAKLPQAQALFDRAAEVLGYDLAAICFDGPAERLDATDHCQPALFVCGLAALAQLRQDDPAAVANCAATAGLSLGEYTALVFADVLDFDDALRVVQQRGRAMQAASEAKPSGMVSVLGLEVEQVERLCEAVRQEGEILQVANLLCPGNTAVSGDLAACERLLQAAPAAGAMKAVRLSVAGAFHTPLMQSAVDQLAGTLADVPLRTPRIPVISNVDAQPHHDPEEIRQLLVRQVVSPVQWEASMRTLMAQGVDRFYEIGPGRVLRGLLRRIERKLACENITA